jgi:cyclopropane fatty-acyl-phospholipid synthase-like methyltransferase
MVAEGYDALDERFGEWRDRIVGDPRGAWVERLTSQLRDGDRVLELGCGDGLASTRDLAGRFEVTGVDISPAQISRARTNVQSASFIEADFTAVDFEPGSFEAVVAFYSFNHVPRELLPRLLDDIHHWLVPGGHLLAAFGTGDTEAWTGDWLGTTMFFSSYPSAANSALVDAAGFERLLDEVVTFREPEPDGEVQFQWMLARR